MTSNIANRINSSTSINELINCVENCNFLTPYNVIAAIKKADSLKNNETTKKTNLINLITQKAQWDKLNPSQLSIAHKFYRSHRKEFELTQLASTALNIEPKTPNDEISDKTLCSHLNKCKVDSLEGAARFFKIVSDNMERLNSIHWAVIGGKLFHIARGRNKTNPNIANTIQTIIQMLNRINLSSFGKGEIAQLLGGVVPFLDRNNAQLKAKLCCKIQELAGDFNKQELIMILETIRKAPKNFSELYTHLLEYCFSEQQPFPFNQHSDLLAILFQGWAENGIWNQADRLLQEYFKTETSFSDINKMQVLDALGTHMSRYINEGQASFLPCIEKTLNSLRATLEKNNRAFTPHQLIGLQATLSNIRYFDPKWNNAALEAIYCHGALWEKILLISHLSSSGALTPDCDQDFKDKLFDLAREYLQSENKNLHNRYPGDLCMLARTLMMLLECHEKNIEILVWPLIEIASKQNLEKDHIQMLFQAATLSKYKKAIPQFEKMNPEKPRPSEIQLVIDKEIRRNLQKYSTCRIVTEEPLMGTTVDMAIYGLSKDDRPIIVEIDGPSHYALNSLTNKPLISVGSTYLKHRMIRESGAHLVVIPVNGWHTSDSKSNMEQVVAEILSYSAFAE